jgi:NAD(P)-dependent dehydrogenase (short-subunit alcohol dehydrogenase family)
MSRGAAVAAPRVVLITGASSGIGLAVAHELAEAGDHLVLLARSDLTLQRAARECRARGAASVSVRALDVRDDAAVREVLARVVRDHGRLDLVVHSAGVAGYGRFEQVPTEVFDGIVSANLLGAANVARAALPHLRHQRAGSLYLVGSVIGTIAVPSMTPYAVTKWAVRALARQLQLENRDLPDVHVVLVTPGGVDTPIYAQASHVGGRAGTPPPPVYSPQRVARALVRSLHKPPRRLDVGITNPLIQLGFMLAPRLYDLLVGPLFTLLATSSTKSAATTGNVLGSVPDHEQLTDPR